MSEQEKQEQPPQQDEARSQGGDRQQDKSPAAATAESPDTEKQTGAPETKIRGCFDDIETGEGTGARGGEYS